jgi:predicted acetyltransferase
MPSNPLPDPPSGLRYEGVSLYFDRLVPADPVHGLAPYYHFCILSPDGWDAGHWNLRIGDNDHIQLYAGHVGYGVHEGYRGSNFARLACLAAAPFVRQIYREVIITADPDNLPSLRTIEKLGAEFLNEVSVPPTDPQYLGGSRFKRRYRWTP